MSNFRNGQYSIKSKTYTNATAPGQVLLASIIGGNGRLLGIQCRNTGGAVNTNSTTYLNDGSTVLLNVAAVAAGENRLWLGPCAAGVTPDMNVTLNNGSIPWPLPVTYTDYTAGATPVDYKITINCGVAGQCTIFYTDEP